VAKKYFGNENPINKVINFNSEIDLTVTGLIEDAPKNSDFPFRILISSNVGSIKRGWEDWGATSSSINCYIKLNPTISQHDFEEKLRTWHLKYFTGKYAEDGKNRRYILQPLKELHFDSRFPNFSRRTVSYSTLFTLSSIGLLLLVTACINFINLNTVLIINRAKEAGVRKVMGSSRAQLVGQFLGETFFITVISLLASTGLAELALINLSTVLGYRLEFNPFQDTATLLFLISLPLIVSVLSGLYPAIKLSRFEPAAALKSKLSGNPGQGMTLRRGLIVFQLMIAQVLVVSTIIVVQQINYFMTQPLGINSEAVVEFELPENKPELIHKLSERLSVVPGVQSVSMSNTGSTSGNQWSGDFEATVNGKLVKENANVKLADENFVKTYQIKLIHGEDLVKSDSATRFVVNESFVRALGLKNPQEAIGVPVDLWGRKAVITGIVQDFNTSSMHEKRGPTIMLSGVRSYFVGAVRLENKNVLETLKAVQSVWEDVYPNYVFEYQFLDDTIREFYDGERRNSYLIGIFSGVAIFIGSIGLFGLVSFMAKAKTKEVGIRKTLGASAGQVIALFSKEFLVLIGISFALSSPLAYYVMNEWLSNFAYRIYPGVTTFLIGVAVTLVVVIGTVGFRSYRAAIANPVDALRDE
jgi:putative ABC transport system permease protein